MPMFNAQELRPARGGDEARYLLDILLESIRDGIAVFDSTGCISSCNSALALLCMRSLEEIVGKHPSELWGGQDPFEGMPAGVTSTEDILIRADSSVRNVLVRQLHLPGDPPVRAAIYRDITRLKAMEQKGRHAEDQYRFLLEHVNDGIIITQYDTIVYVNTRLARMLGYEREELLMKGRQLLETPQPDQNVTATPRPFDRNANRYETVYHHRDGREVHVEIAVSRGPYNGEEAVFEVVRDITSRRIAERHSSLLLSLGQKLNLSSTPREVAAVTFEAADEMFGWDACSLDLADSPDTLYLVPVLYMDTIHDVRCDVSPTKPERMLHTIAGQVLSQGPRLILREENDTNEGLIPFGDVTRRSRSLMFVPIRGGPDVVGVISVQSYQSHAYTHADVEALQALADHCSGALRRTQALQSVHENEERYRQMFEKNRAIKLLINPGTGAIIDANPAACQFYGCDLEEIRSRSLGDFAVQPPEELQVDLDLAVQEKKNYHTTRHRLTSGVVRDIEMFATPIQSHGETLLHTIVHDVTDRKRALAQIAALAELGRRLSSATNTTDAGRMLVDVADKVIGWDACFVHLFASDVHHEEMTPGHLLVPVIHMDLIKGVRREVAPLHTVMPASAISYRTLQEGAHLILRKSPDEVRQDVFKFGDTSRPSLSLMYAPIHGSNGVLGVLSIQSYSANAYGQSDLDMLQALADHCGGAMERTRAEEQVRLLESAVRLARDMIMITFADPTNQAGSRIVFVNDAFLQATGYTREELIGQSPAILQGPDTDVHVLERMRESLSAGCPINVELVNYRKDRTSYIVEFSAYAIADAFGRSRYFVSVQRDVTERKRNEVELAYKAMHDPLTALANRAMLLERLEHAMARARRSNDRFAVLFLDLDGFKEVNDRFGHYVGDQILISCARRLELCVRPGDTVARLGGDEFVVLLEAVEQSDDATKVASRILESFEFPHQVQNEKVVCTASVGIAQQDLASLTAMEILKCADAALYQAKANGKSRYEIYCTG